MAAGATAYTDGSGLYGELWLRYRHGVVNHAKGQYRNGDACTNGIESMWALLKRTYMGTHHWVSPKHLHRYLAELAGRHNMTHLAAMGRVAALVRGMEGKRLQYAELVR